MLPLDTRALSSEIKPTDTLSFVILMNANDHQSTIIITQRPIKINKSEWFYHLEKCICEQSGSLLPVYLSRAACAEHKSSCTVAAIMNIMKTFQGNRQTHTLVSHYKAKQISAAVINTALVLLTVDLLPSCAEI